MTRYALVALSAVCLTGVAQAQPISVSYGGGQVKATQAACARKAVGAMTAEKFARAGVTEDGHALGWTDSTTVLVMTVPQQDDNVAAIVLAAGRDQKEAERLRHAVLNYLGGKPDVEGAPAKVVSKVEGTKAPSVRWLTRSRDAVATVKYFVPVASLHLEKRGYNVFSEPGKTVVLGADGQRAAVTFAAPGTSALKIQFAFAAFGSDDEACERMCKPFSEAVFQTLFD